MLRSLRIENLILIERMEVHFHPALNVITGETGAGKSALLRALSLLTGAKGSREFVRAGASLCSIEALFAINTPLEELLAGHGLSHQPGDLLLIRRNLDSEGKSFCYINHQYVQQRLLQEVGSHLLQIVSQHASRQLLSPEAHRQLLDRFAETYLLVQEQAFQWQQLQKLEKERHQLIEEEKRSLREKDTLVHQCGEIEQAALRPGEEEELFSEYSRLAHAEQLQEQLDSCLLLLDGEGTGVIEQLHRVQKLLQQATAKDSSLQPSVERLAHLSIELVDLDRELNRYQASLGGDRFRQQALEERLTQIERLKKRYGPTIEEIGRYQLEARARLEQLEKSQERLELLEAQQAILRQQLSERAEAISKARHKAAPLLAEAMNGQLASMNMKGALFEVELAQGSIGPMGRERVQFYLTPNRGEKRLPLQECASGGELSRLTLAHKLLLAQKEELATLIFDEIDANIGGETARLVAERLAQLAQQQQLLCVTHFAQVAALADGHFQISKKEEEGRTYSLLKELEGSDRQAEFARMRGGEYSALEQNP